ALVDGVEIVVAGDHDVVAHAGRYAAGGRTGRGRRCAGIHQRQIEVPVIVAGKLQHAGAAGKSSRHTYCAHDRFGPRGYEAQALHRREIAANALAEPDLVFVGAAPNQSGTSEPIEAANECRMRVAEEQWTVRHDVVDVTPPLRVESVRPPCACLEEHGRVDAPRRTDR